MKNSLMRTASLIMKHPSMLSARLRKLTGTMPRLDTVYVECAGVCNLDCHFCYSRHTSEHLGLMSRETFFRVARELFPYAYSVNFVGYGEPLLNPHLGVMLRTVKSYGREAHLTTNGTLLSMEKIRELIAAEIDSIAVSLDGATAAVHDANRGTGNFERTCRNLEALRHIKEETGSLKPLLYIDSILTRSNRAEIGLILERASSLGASCVNLGHLQVNIRQDDQESLLGEGSSLKDDFSTWREKAHVLGVRLRLPEEVATSTGKGCFWDPGHRLAVTWDGKVRPCCFLIHPNRWYAGGEEKAVEPPLLGDLPGRSFPSIWRNNEYRRFRDAVARTDWPQACEPCPLRAR